MISFPEVKSCCCFISLRTATKLFGFISLVGSLFLILMFSTELVLGARRPVFGVAAIALQLFGVTVYITQSVTSVFLLLGVYQERAKLIPPWLVSTVIVVVCEILFTPSIIDFFVFVDRSPWDLDWILIFLFTLVDDVYGFLVVYSYHRSLVGNTVQ